MPIDTGTDFFHAEPAHTHDALIELAIRLQQAHGARESKAQVSDVLLGGVGGRGPLKAGQVDPDQCIRGEGVSRFFQGLARAVMERDGRYLLFSRKPSGVCSSINK